MGKWNSLGPGHVTLSNYIGLLEKLFKRALHSPHFLIFALPLLHAWNIDTMPEIKTYLAVMKWQAQRQKPHAMKTQLKKRSHDTGPGLPAPRLLHEEKEKEKKPSIWLSYCRRILVTCSWTYFGYKEVSQPRNDRSRLNSGALDSLSCDISNKLQCLSKSRICPLHTIQTGILNLCFLSQQIAYLNDLSHSSNGEKRFIAFVFGFFSFLTCDTQALVELLRHECLGYHKGSPSFDQNFFQSCLRKNWPSSQILPWLTFLPWPSHSLRY